MNKKYGKRDELVAKLQELQKQESEIRKELSVFTYQENFDKANAYVGRYFKEENNIEEYKDAMNKITTLRNEIISYWSDNQSKIPMLELKNKI